MAPPSLWSGNLRLSLVLIPVKLCPAVSNEEAVSFRMIHEPSGKPIRYVKCVHDGDEFVEVPEEEIVKGYEHAKVEHRAPEVVITPDGKPAHQVINIMDALKQSMQKQDQAKVRDSVRKRMGKTGPKEAAPRPPSRSRAGTRRSLH